jgi:hypothetical protein
LHFIPDPIGAPVTRALLLSAACLLAPLLLAGDVTLTSRATGSRREENGTQVLYLSTDRARGKLPSGSEVFLDYRQGAITVLNPDPARPGKVKGMRVSYAQLEQYNQMLNSSAARRSFQKAQVAEFGGDPQLQVETVGKETLLGRVCTKYRATLGTHVYEVSLDPTLDNTIYKAFERATAAFATSFQGAGTGFERGLAQMMKTLKGVPLRFHESIPDRKYEYSWVATALSTQPIPAETLSVPGDVKVETMPNMGGLMNPAVSKPRRKGD